MNFRLDYAQCKKTCQKNNASISEWSGLTTLVRGGSVLLVRLTTRMFKITDKRRATYFLKVREQGGIKVPHFLASNKQRYVAIIGLIGGLCAYWAFTDQWFLLWLYAALACGVLFADLSWFRSMQKSWPFFSRTLNWSEVEKIANETQ